MVQGRPLSNLRPVIHTLSLNPNRRGVQESTKLLRLTGDLGWLTLSDGSGVSGGAGDWARGGDEGEAPAPGETAWKLGEGGDLLEVKKLRACAYRLHDFEIDTSVGLEKKRHSSSYSSEAGYQGSVSFLKLKIWVLP